MQLGSLLVGLGVVSGMMIAAQGAMNGRLGYYLGGPLQAALISFTVGWCVLLAVNVLLGHRPVGLSTLGQAPWWAWLGGALGAVMVAGAATAVPRIGVAAWIGAVMAGQLIAAVLYDHIGAFDQDVRHVTPLRLVGIGFLIVGVYLVKRF